MKAKAIGYWASTGIVALLLMSGGAAQVMRRPENVEGFARLGYPVHFMVMLGIWKVLGGIALLAPRFPRLKEWAYAGIFIDFLGATVACAANDGGVGHILAPLICTAILMASWALRPQSRILGTLPTTP